MRIESFACWQCEQPKHYTILAWHQIKPGQMELICDTCWSILRGETKEKAAA